VKKREAAKGTRRQKKDIFHHRDKVRGIINTILRTPGCFLSPKNVLPFNGGVCREMWKKVHIYIYISAQKITIFYKQYKIH
jgi:5'(3')-deoxyribonucleotidase